MIGDAAIEVIAAEGMRGLTHRAVDRAAGLPDGSTSYYARTRLALLELTADRMVALDEAEIAPPPGKLAEFLGAVVHRSITAGRTRMLARYEFALESVRRPELRARYDAGGRELRRRCAEILAAVGSSTPETDTRTVLGWMDGSIFDALAGSGSLNPPGEDELVAGARAVLAGLGLAGA